MPGILCYAEDLGFWMYTRELWQRVLNRKVTRQNLLLKISLWLMEQSENRSGVGSVSANIWRLRRSSHRSWRRTRERVTLRQDKITFNEEGVSGGQCECCLESGGWGLEVARRFGKKAASSGLTHNGILLGHKKNEIFLTICDSMDGSRRYYYTQWNKSAWERQVLYDFIRMWNLKKKINEQRKLKQTHRHRENWWLPEGRAWGTGCKR